MLAGFGYAGGVVFRSGGEGDQCNRGVGHDFLFQDMSDFIGALEWRADGEGDIQIEFTLADLRDEFLAEFGEEHEPRNGEGCDRSDHDGPAIF